MVVYLFVDHYNFCLEVEYIDIFIVRNLQGTIYWETFRQIILEILDNRI